MAGRGNDRFATDPTGALAAGAPGGIRGLSPLGGLSVGRVGTPMPDITRAPGNTVGTGYGASITLPIGKSQKSSVAGRAKGGKIKLTPAEAVHKHERNMHKGKTPTKFAKGGSTASKRGDGCAVKGKTKGRFV